MLPLLFALAGDVTTPRWRAPAALFERVEARAPWQPPLAWAGRIYTSPAVHVGVRANALYTRDETGIAVTFQVTADLFGR